MSTPSVETAGPLVDMDEVQAILDDLAAADAPSGPEPDGTAEDVEATGWGMSVFAVIDTAFAAMNHGDDPVGLNCTEWAGLGLPARFLPLRDLRDWMLEHPTNYGARAVVWRDLVTRARQDPQWVTASAGMALPALVAAAGKIARGFTGDPCDIDGEILAAFLHGLHTLDLDDQRLYSRLRWLGYRAGLAVRHAHQPYILLGDIENAVGMAPHLPYGHPDLIVVRAVQAEVIERDDAELIVITRLEQTPIEAVAQAWGIDAPVLRMRRKRAETVLVDALVGGVLSGAIAASSRDELAARARARKARRTPWAA